MVESAEEARTTTEGATTPRCASRPGGRRGRGAPTEGPACPPELVARARAGCQRAFAEIHRRTRPRVHGIARLLLNDSHRVEDAVQETYLQVLCSLPRLTDPKLFEGWLLRIARNTSLNVRRTRTRSLQPTERAHREDLDHDVRIGRVISRTGSREPSPQVVAQVRSAWRELPDRVRETVRMYYFDGRDCDEIAGALGTTRGAVKTRLFRGRRMLRESPSLWFARPGARDRL